jgi:hypothetical protein
LFIKNETPPLFLTPLPPPGTLGAVQQRLEHELQKGEDMTMAVILTANRTSNPSWRVLRHATRDFNEAGCEFCEL